MTELTVEDFNEFIKEVYGYEPFPWQSSLAKKVIDGEGWPDKINIPTGAGKTMVVDIAVFHLAKTASEGTEGQSAPRRIFHTVDRRLIVDNVYTKGQKIKEKLESPEDGSITQEVADRLQRVSSTGSTIEVARLRGGVPSDEEWINDPTQPAIIATTVDHVGSRLLFRGYGVSDNSKPIHAGLAGNDSLHILDEAHLSKPMEDTLEDVSKLRTDSDLPFETVSLSATIKEKDNAWPPNDGLKQDKDHTKLAPRLEAEKWTTIRKAANKSDEEAEFVNISVECCKELMRSGGVSVVGAIVNRVGTARNIFDELRKIGDSEVILLTGRMRTKDREEIIDKYWDRIKAGRERDDEEKNLFVVATQTVEVGVDIDLDAMVTELAPVDSLKQRFGRLDRYGKIRETEARVIARHSQTLSSNEDPVYGDILDDVYDSLKEQDEPFDMGNSGISFPEDCPEHSLDELTLTPNHRPSLIEPYIEKLNQTSPIPDPDPDVSLFLHGVDSSPGEVNVIWRSDLSSAEEYQDVIEESPPSTKETLSLPVWAFKNWMDEKDTEVSDIEGISGGHESGGEQKDVIRWSSDEGTEVIEANEVGAGDLIILPSEAGGYDQYGFNPESEDNVEDIGNDVFQDGTQLPIRIHPSLCDRLEWGEDIQERFFKIDSTTGEREVDASEVSSFIKESEDIEAELENEEFEAIPYPEGDGIIAIESESAEGGMEYPTVTLPEHTENVVSSVRSYLEVLNLPEEIADDIATSAEYHDIGKADERFQKMLHGGDVVSYRESTELLAKSHMSPSEREEARRKANYPSGTRHETFSASLIQDSQALEDANDPQLVLHIVASHHGYHRPFVSKQQGSVSIEYRDDTRDLQLEAESEYYGLLNFAELTEGYGYWRLAYIESILRTGDRRASMEEVQ